MKPKTAVAVIGLPLSGKSSLGRALAAAAKINFVDIDEGPASCVIPQEPNPYRSDEAHARERARMAVAYTVLHAAVEANLTQGFSVVVAACYTSSTSRSFLQDAVIRGGGNLKIICCRFQDTPEEVERRIAERLTRGLVGGCRTAGHYFSDKSRSLYAKIELPHIVVMMEGGQAGLGKAVQESLAYINDDGQ